jgi:hypothetical protein
MAVDNEEVAELNVLEAAEPVNTVKTLGLLEMKQLLALLRPLLTVTTKSQSQQHPRFHAVYAAGPGSASPSTQKQQLHLIVF